MSELQKESVSINTTATRYVIIKKVFDDLPCRFKLLDLFKAAGIKDGPQQRNAYSAVLQRDFKCRNIVRGPVREWVKP